MKCNSVYQCVERKIGGIFAKYGRFVAAHAWKILIVSILVNGGLGIGMMKLELDNDASNYLPSGTQAEEDEKRIEGLFPDLDYSNFDSLRLIYGGPWVRLIVRSKSGNLLTRQMLEQVQSLTNAIQNITADDGYGQTVTFTDVCAKINGHCAVGGQLFVEEEFLSAVDIDTVTYPEFNTSTRGMVYYAPRLGGKIEFDASGKYLKRMEFIRLEIMIPFWGRDEWVCKLNQFSNCHLNMQLLFQIKVINHNSKVFTFF
ncbi:patched domain-containing protein 3-like isoform X2 [Mercenaria mercenaria]|nr:patched domain-containing protein 3-like isoform X2 [Mercenaria mercenaria]XP_045200387.2 patched domain-containing protein 3-like isoform X2 [Mercenaria mercenaria]